MQVSLKKYGMSPDDMYVEFIDGDKCRVAISGQTQEGTYTKDGKNITITVDGDPASGTIDGNKLTIVINEQTMVFEKK